MKTWDLLDGFFHRYRSLHSSRNADHDPFGVHQQGLVLPFEQFELPERETSMCWTKIGKIASTLRLQMTFLFSRQLKPKPHMMRGQSGASNARILFSPLWIVAVALSFTCDTVDTDPTKAFYQFAAQMRFDKKVKGLSLGQGQGLKATRLIEEASQKGTWVSGRNVYAGHLMAGADSTLCTSYCILWSR